jgi:CRISPR/Cas system CSM-associated protein Csm3 (group 7 of RAMP superfamily)
VAKTNTVRFTGMSIRRVVTTMAPPLVPGSSMGGKFKLSVESADRRVRGTRSADVDGGGIIRDCRGPDSRAPVEAAVKVDGLLCAGEKAAAEQL